MKGDLVRIGKVSSVDTATGMAKVTYPDRDASVTAEIPVFAFTDEYKMPPVGTQVLVLHLSNDTAMGVVLGRYWGTNNPPPVQSGFHKELGSTPGEAYLQYDAGTLTIHAQNIVLDGSVSLAGDIAADGISLKDHTHMIDDGKTSKPQ